MRQADDPDGPDVIVASGTRIDTEFLKFIPQTTPVGVAVSGGSDSIAMLRLLAERFPVSAVTVDHGLRDGSAAEARFVAETCARLAIPHDILRWSGPQPTGNLMDQARRARLALIGGWAARHGIEHVALGHTSDDQAETFLMRVARSSGLEGLSGMRGRFVAEGVTWHRPLLQIRRETLRDYLREIKQIWIDDPSNENTRFDRVKMRNALKTLSPLGLTPETIGAVVAHLATAESALQSRVADEVARHVRCDRGDILIDAPAFQSGIEPELRRRVMNAALLWVSRADYAPRAAKLAGFLSHPRDCTLHGCRILVDEAKIRITREANAVVTLRVQTGQIWDRWELMPDAPPPLSAYIGALGAVGLKLCPDWRASGLPRASLLASPAVWDGENLLCAPLAGVENGWKTRIACDGFAESLFRR